MGQELELPRPILTEITKDNARRETIQRRFTRDSTNEGSNISVPAKDILPNRTKELVEAHAETTILCTFGPCTLTPNPSPGSVMPA